MAQAALDTLRTFQEIPYVPLMKLLPRLIGNGGGRIDLLSGLQEQYDELGVITRQGVGRSRASTSSARTPTGSC